ncbi:Maf family protein, partial [Prevotella pectinovora]
MIKQYNIILGSGSPRRKELLSGLDLHFRVLVRDGIKETYPQDLPAKEVARYIAEEKASAYTDLLSGDTMVITADTIVVCDDTILGKPHDINDAVRMLKMLSGKTHQVITGVCIST